MKRWWKHEIVPLVIAILIMIILTMANWEGIIVKNADSKTHSMITTLKISTIKTTDTVLT